MPILIAPPTTPINTTKLATISAITSASIDDELAKATNESLSMGSSIVTDIDNVSFIFPPRHKLHPGLYVTNRGVAVTTDGGKNNPKADIIDNDDATAVVTSSLLNCHLASMQLYHTTVINNHDSTTATTQNNSIYSNNMMIKTTNDNNDNSEVDKTRTTGCRSGVPGFPDFPDCWDGIEPPSTPKMSNRKNNKQNSHHDVRNNKKGKQTRCCHRRKIHRSAVNAPFGSSAASATIVSRSNTGKEMKRNARDERKLRRIAKVTQLKERRRRKKDMGDICRGMAAIKW